jgi:transposase InsO family protein
VVEKFPSRISTIRTGNGHEFQPLSRRHVEGLGMGHAYIRVRTPRPNGEVERSHRTDKGEFYRSPTYAGDVELNVKPEEWQNFHNYHRPHSALAGKTPYETLREKLNLNVARARVE